MFTDFYTWFVTGNSLPNLEGRTANGVNCVQSFISTTTSQGLFSPERWTNVIGASSYIRSVYIDNLPTAVGYLWDTLHFIRRTVCTFCQDNKVGHTSYCNKYLLALWDLIVSNYIFSFSVLTDCFICTCSDCHWPSLHHYVLFQRTQRRE